MIGPDPDALQAGMRLRIPRGVRAERDARLRRLVRGGGGDAVVGLERVLVRAAAPARLPQLISDLRHRPRTIRRVRTSHGALAACAAGAGDAGWLHAPQHSLDRGG